MTESKPIFSIGRYSLVYRSDDEYHALKTQDKGLPVVFGALRFLAGVGAFLATMNVVGAVLQFFAMPLALLFVIGVLVLIGIILNFGEFLDMFKVIDNTHPNPTTPPNTRQSTIGFWHSLVVFVLALLCVVRFYLRYGLHLPLVSPTLLGIDTVLMVFGLPYFTYGAYRRFFRQWS